MKKDSMWIGGMATLLLTFMVALAGCSSAPVVYDKSVPPEQSSIINISGCFVRVFDGQITDGKWWAAFDTKTLQIPAGDHVLEIFNKVEMVEGGTESGTVTVHYTFLPGHTYLIVAPIYLGKITARIIDEVVLNKEVIPDPENPDATPFEGKWVITNETKGFQWIFAKDDCILMLNGKNYLRGSFTYDEKRVYVIYSYVYSSKKGWQPTSREIKTDHAYNGNVIAYDKKNDMKKL